MNEVIEKTNASADGLLATLTLVSSSPQRRNLLREAGYRFRIIEPRLHEPDDRDKSPNLTPAQHAQALAYFKARSVADENPDCLLLGADTVIAVGNDVFGKARDRDDAARILRVLTTTPHQVITGVALLHPAGDRRLIAHAATRMVMRPMSDEQLEGYLDSGAWEGKAGAYGLQAGGDAFVERIEGSYSNVIGLPMELLARLLQRIGGV